MSNQTSPYNLLSNDAYTDPDYLERERSSVLRSTWQFAGRVSQLPNIGDAIPTTIAASPVLLLRDGNGDIRAFDNVCPHRGTKLLSEPACKLDTVVCPYHAWTFGLDGTLRARPHFYGADQHDRVADDRPRPRLWDLRAEIWFDWIFVNLDTAAPPLADVIAPIVNLMDGYDFRGCVYGGSLEFDVASNWKLAHENYLDVLHKFKLHPELEKAAPLRTNSSYDWIGHTAVVSHRLEAPTDGRGGALPALPDVTENVRELGVAAHLFPNTNFMYWRDQAVLFVCDPIAPDHTVEHFHIYFAEEAMQGQFDDARGDVFATWDHLNRQDIGPLEWMQAGRRAVNFDGGSFSDYWDPQIIEYLARLNAATK
tara:strand:+ start:71 stop:1171 length:1101 start_codon:yes stop_codon:yes gene_type:complete